MVVEIKLFGFGDDRPESFLGRNQLKLELESTTTPRTALLAAGIDDTNNQVLMINDEVIPIQQWDEPIVGEGTVLMVLCAFEGG